MTISKWGSDALFLTHQGFSPNPADYSQPNFHMSYEFATWLTGWDRGLVGSNAYHTRNFTIARRKSCYATPLLGDLGIFTEEGQRVLARAKVYMAQIRNYYESLNISYSDIPQWDSVHEMDKIIIVGLVETKHLVFLRTLYNRIFPNASVYTHMGQELPNDIHFEFVEYPDPLRNGEPTLYMTTSALRNYPHRRKHFELMVKFGLIEVRTLPKMLKQLGRGRAPVGATLTETGKRFFEAYLENFDPIRVKQRQIERSMRGED